MAKCEKCGNGYYTRECLVCANGASKKHTYKSNNIKIIFGIIIAICIVMVFKFMFGFNSNPLLGEWNSKSMLGKYKVVFKKDSMETMGMVSKVEYDIQDDRVIVTDQWKIGTIINIIDENTLESSFAGIKTKYKRTK